MRPILALVYGAAAYVVFLGTILYAIGFVSGFVVPKTINSGSIGPIGEALVINVLLLSLFAVQHSVMARKPFKRWWTQIVPAPIERSTYVLLASLALHHWCSGNGGRSRRSSGRSSEPHVAMATAGAPRSSGGASCFLSTFLINHFELFGAAAVVLNLARPGREPEPRLKTPLLYRVSPASALSRLHHRVLGDAGNDHRSSALRDRHHGVHPGCHRPRGARPDGTLR